MQVTIETINGKLCTVVWHAKECQVWVHEDNWDRGAYGLYYCFEHFGVGDAQHIATALPSLPRNPKPEDAPLLYRYMAEGISIKAKYIEEPSFGFQDILKMWGYKQKEITHATHNGTRIEIAIEENADA